MNIFLAYLFYFIAASASPLQRRWLAKKKDVDGKGQTHFAFQVSFIIAVLSFLILFFEPFYLGGNLLAIILLTFISGVFGALFFVFSYRAQKHVEAGVMTLISNLYTPIVIVLAILFLNETLTLIQVLGTLFLLAGVFIVSKKHQIKRFTFDKYFLSMVLASVFLAIDITAERALQKITGFSAAFIFISCAQALFLWLAVLVTKSKSHYTKKDITITSSLRFLQSLSWVILIFTVGNLSIVASITTFKVVIMFIAGALILGEKDHLLRKILGSIIAVIGLLLMK